VGKGHGLQDSTHKLLNFPVSSNSMLYRNWPLADESRYAKMAYCGLMKWYDRQKTMLLTAPSAWSRERYMHDAELGNFPLTADV